MVVAMWKEWNEFPCCALILHGCGHVEEKEEVPWCEMISYMVVTMWVKRRDLI